LLYPAELRAQIWTSAISLRTRAKIQFYWRGIAKLSVASSNFISGKEVDLDLLRVVAQFEMRRFTRLTNGFSKKIENHEHAVAIHYIVLQLRAH